MKERKDEKEKNEIKEGRTRITGVGFSAHETYLFACVFPKYMLVMCHCFWQLFTHVRAPKDIKVFFNIPNQDRFKQSPQVWETS